MTIPTPTPTRVQSGEVAGRAVDEEPDDQPTDDTADEDPAESDEVAATQSLGSALCAHLTSMLPWRGRLAGG